MSDDAHPLLPVILEWAANAPSPLVPFAPIHEFQREVDLAVLHDSKFGHEYAKEQEWKTYTGAAALGSVLCGEPYSIELHAMIYRAASGSPLAFALCDAAGQAHQLGTKFFSAFAVSSRLSGFMSALEVWMKIFDYDRPFSGCDQLPFIYREIIRKEVPHADFWSKACQDGFSSSREFHDASASEVLRADDAERKRASRKSTRGEAQYRKMIESGWLTLSLWARTAKDIAYLLNPELDAPEKETGRVARDISEFHKIAKMSNSHRGREYGGIIERAERAAKKVL